MVRWEPNARERLQAAALALFEERGYDRTTVGDIAARAELTERTFFRYFTDKREVLFAGSDDLATLLASGVASAPKSLSPLDAVAAALEATSPVFEPLRPTARKRQALIAAHPELRERELAKSTKVAGALELGLRERGVAQHTAALLSLTGMILFQNAFKRWVDDSKKRDLAHHLRESLAELRQLTATPAPRRSGRA